MEIMKIFSDVEGDEVLYSVLMTEDEVTLFSEIQKEFNSKAQKALRRKFDTEVGKTFNPTGSKSNVLRLGRATLRGEDYHSGVHRDITGKIVGNGADKYYGNGIHDLINRKGREGKFATSRTAAGKKAESQFYRASRMAPGSLEAFEMHDKAVENLLKHRDEVEISGTPKSVKIKNLKKAGKIAAATVGTAGLIYGAKKLYDKKKKEED